MRSSCLLSAPAKLNLSLRIGRRSSATRLVGGLHKLESHIVFLDLHDRLEVEDREDAGSLAVEFCDTHAVEESFLVGKDHSLSRAARALAVAVASKSVEGGMENSADNLAFAWKIVVQKAIPAGAGLGGGSSDAASFLRYARTRGLGALLSDAEWLSVARAVGSDVALFLLRARSNCVFVSGFGERVLEQEALPVCGVVLVCGAGLSTASVYERYARNQAEGRKDAAADVEIFSEACLSTSPSARLSSLLEAGGNDLLVAACALDGSIVERLKALRSCEEVFCARMTGSGSACFGLTELGCEEGVAARLRARGFRGAMATRFLQGEEGDGVDKARRQLLE